MNSPFSYTIVQHILFGPLLIFLTAIDLLLTLITFGWVNILRKKYGTGKFSDHELRTRLFTHPVDGKEHHRQSRGHPSFGKLPYDNVYHGLLHGYKLFPNNRCMGVREYLGYYKGNKRIKHYNGKKVTWKTYSEAYGIAHQFGSALIGVANMEAAPSTTTLDKCVRPNRLAIFENTCPEWMMATIGAFSQSITIVTIYATLGIDAVLDAVEDNSISTILCHKRSVKEIIRKMQERKNNKPDDKKPPITTLKTIVYNNYEIAPDEIIELPSDQDTPSDVNIINFYDFAKLGDTTKYPVVAPKPGTNAVIMYTSGSTGKPKGVVITHKAITSAAQTAEWVLKNYCSYPPEFGKEVHCGFLPLAHIFEFLMELSLLYGGSAIGYADPKSLSTGTQAYPYGALETYRPTAMPGVPKIWDIMKKTAIQKVEARPYVSQYIFRYVYPYRKFALEHGFDTPFYKLILFIRFRKALGYRVRYAVSGGGPLSPDVQEFIRICFCCPIIQGYGLTETCAGCTVQEEDDIRTGIVGTIGPRCEVKLESCPDICDRAGLPYLVTDRVGDNEGEPILGRGEICIRGGHLSLGYYNMAEKTAESFIPSDDPPVKDDPESIKNKKWFHTGDIGQFTQNGVLRIIDRKKNLVKLKGGEYIALEQMEMVYSNSIFVNNIDGGCMCYGDGDMDRSVMLMQVQEDYVMKKWIYTQPEFDIGKTTYEEILESSQLMTAVLGDIHGMHKKASRQGLLSHLEKVVAIGFLNSNTDPWTPENECLTSSNKVNRNFILRKHDSIMNTLKEKGTFD